MRAIVSEFILSTAFAALAFAQTADLAVVNAHIYTVDPSHPTASAIAVQNNKILAVADDISRYLAPTTKIIDAKGAIIVPGFIDSHGHVRALGDMLGTLDLRGITSLSEIAAKVQAAALSHAAPATPDPPGGKILRDPNGAPTGVLLDQAMDLITRRIPQPTQAQIEASLLRATRTLARLGITTVHDAGVQYADLDAYRALIRKGQLPIHIYAMILYPLPLPDKPEIGDHLTVRSLKIIADGALGSRGAALLEPHTDNPGNRGLLILDRAAIRAALEAYADVLKGPVLKGPALKGPNDKRFRIEHAQVVAPEDFPKFRQYSILASMQATHATSDMLWAPERLGPARIKGAYAWQTFLHLGVHVPNGSDFPVEDPNPLLGFYAAITRRKPDGTPPNGWFPAQRMSREEALRSWTLEGARAAFEEHRKGSLEPGKLADFVMLSADIMTIPPSQIPHTRVTLTVADGKIVFQQ